VQPFEHHISLATAIAVGLLIGLQREQAKVERQSGSMIAGVRTYPIFALVGALATLLEPASMWLPLMALLGVFALVAISYAADVRRSKSGEDHGATTEISLIATYLLGALAASRGVVEPMETRLILVAGLGVVIAFLLSSKPLFHKFAQRVSRDDYFATIKFLIVAVIVLPLLPDDDMGPLDAINPRHLGILVVTISGLSFVGYVAMRLWGAQRGMLAGGALGGLVSSTAVTLSFANRAKQDPSLAPMAAGAIAVAWTVMLGRVAVLVAIVSPRLLATLAVPLGAMMLAMIGGLLLTFRRHTDGTEGALELENPFELGSAIKVTLMFGLVLLVTRAATEYIGDQGLYLAAALGGTTDVDAITLSSARLASSAVTPIVAVTSIAIAIWVNTLVKLGLAGGIAGAGLGRRLGLVSGMVIVAGAVGLGVTAGIA
jgi:uncharacterized membrane protein (DUF4010 family)